MRVLVTGAAGFIGHHLVRALAADGHDVVALDALRGDPATTAERTRRLAAMAEHVAVSRLDLAVDPLDAVLEDVEAVAHLAASTGVRSSYGAGLAGAVRDTVTTTGRLAEACAVAAGRPRLVLASSSSVYGSIDDGDATESHPLRPRSPYGVTKLAAEEMVRAYGATHGLQAVILRYFTVYGPGQRPDMAAARFIAAALAARPMPVLGDGSQRRAFTYVDDVVSATMAALAVPEATGSAAGAVVCNIAGPGSHTVAELAELVARATGTSGAVSTADAAAGDVARTAADTSRAAEMLGWRPQVDLATGLSRQVAAARATTITSTPTTTPGR